MQNENGDISVNPSVNGEAPCASSEVPEEGQQCVGGEYPADVYQEYLDSIPIDVPAVQTLADRWREELILIKGHPDPRAIKNIYLMTRFSEHLRGLFILDEFSQRKHVVKCPPWEDRKTFRARDYRDDDAVRVLMELETLGLKPSKEKVMDCIDAICRDRKYHPARKYFDTIKWDGVPRLHKMMAYYFGCEQEPAEYLEAIGMKWMTAAVARIFEPGCKFDHMLVLEGKTDIGKSKALRTLATFHGTEYFDDTLSFDVLYDKDTMLKIQGCIIIEFPEMSKLDNRSVEEVKQWITMQRDKGRKPYGREVQEYPRQYVLAGSTNTDEYLRDPTGNKRFWPALCGDRIDHIALEKDRPQLWAEAVHLYKSGFQWWIPEGSPLIPVFQEVQSQRLAGSPWHEHVVEYVGHRETVTVREILDEKIKIPIERRTRKHEMELAHDLRMIGFEQSGRVAGARVWRKKAK
jgi:predicted P-loop ATPase